jgi:cobalt-zinc-cadmium resistance protein CzcA
MVVIGGLITATLLTLLVLPAMSQLVLGLTERRRPAAGEEPASMPLPAE